METDTLPPYYRLRWRFDYADRPAKYGMWSRDPDNVKEKACFQTKDGLVRASIEGKNTRTYEIVTLAECDGWDFNNFQWIAEFRAKNGVVGSFGGCRNTGLKLITRDYWIEVFFSGIIKKTPRTEEDKRYHYATFGR